MARAGPDGKQQSRRGRELLSRLAAERGIDCPVDAWSARGSGPLRHPALPDAYHPCLSHRGGRVVAGLADCPVGLDLERAHPRHARRLDDILELLPDPTVRLAIRQSSSPLAAFYRAWTLYEALYKLSSLEGHTPSTIFATPLTQLAPGGDIHAWQWQAGGWTLALCTRPDNPRIRLRPPLALSRVDAV